MPRYLVGLLRKEEPSFGSLCGGSFLNGIFLEEGNRRAVIISLCLISLMQMSNGSGEEEGGVDTRGDGSLWFSHQVAAASWRTE